MNVRRSKPSYNGPEADLARSIKAGIACIFAVGLLSLGACSDGGPAVIKDAVAANPESALAQYFPTQFPAPEGVPEPHVEAF